MPKLTIDKRPIDVAPGATILEAARALDISIPTLCFLDGLPPATSCMTCVVKVKGRENLVPACATIAEDGMEVESTSDEVFEARRTALELLLSDHVGDCMAPCQLLCPARMDIARMNRQIQAGDLRGALITVKEAIALPAVLGRICPAPCEKGCRRAQHDSSVSICLLKRYVADVDLASEEPYLPERSPPTGKRIGIVGAGPAGLAAAYYALAAGHTPIVFDDHDEPGGMLRYAVPLERLPRPVLDGEIGIIKRLGAEFKLGVRVGASPSLEDLRQEFDAVLLATGEAGEEARNQWGLPASKRGIEIHRHSYETSETGVFAAGGAVMPTGKMAVRAVGHGREAVISIDQYLRGLPVTGPHRPFNSRLGKLKDGEIAHFLPEAIDAPRIEPTGDTGGFSDQDAPAEARRCLHCDCRKPSSCKLREYAELYRANQGRFKGERRRFEQYREHAAVIYEPGKCINCGICIRVVERFREPLGLTFLGRGFDVRVGVPFSRSIKEGLTTAAEECVRSCPTGALAFKNA